MSTSPSIVGRVIAFGTALVLTAAACGGDNKSSTNTTAGGATTSAGGSTTAAAGGTTSAGGASTTSAGGASTTTATGGDPLGTPQKATGTPVKIGYISDGRSASIDNTDELLTAEATAKWANDYQNGLAGHPIDLQTCETKQDAALATDCANQMVQKQVAAVVFNVSGQSSSLGKPLQDANVPLIAWQAADIATDKDSTFVLSNGLSSMSQPAAVARDKKYTKAAIIVIDVPGASGPAKTLGVKALANAGVPNADVVAIAPGTADMGPQIQAALGKDPQLVHLIGDSAFCTTALQALQAASYSGTITAISQCISDATIKTVGDYLKGVLVGYNATIDPNDPDYKTFVAVVNKYAQNPGSISLTSNPVGAFAVVSNFVRAMAKASGTITQPSVITTIRGAGALPLAMGAGLTFNCNGKAISILPAVCTSGFVQATLDAQGKPTDFTKVDPGNLQNFG
jgi:branched-chain amino acid transport system substrate-binding protein